MNLIVSFSLVLFFLTGCSYTTTSCQNGVNINNKCLSSKYIAGKVIDRIELDDKYIYIILDNEGQAYDYKSKDFYDINTSMNVRYNPLSKL